MKVHMKYQITGLRDGEPWPAPGSQIDLPDDEGAMVVASGMAEAAPEEESAPEVVKGVKPEPETATAKSDAETR